MALSMKGTGHNQWKKQGPVTYNTDQGNKVSTIYYICEINQARGKENGQATE